jgi:hypothetical protein
VLAAGPSDDPLIFATVANFEILLAAVYTGIGERLFSLRLKRRSAEPRSRMRAERMLLIQTSDGKWRMRPSLKTVSIRRSLLLLAISMGLWITVRSGCLGLLG